MSPSCYTNPVHPGSFSDPFVLRFNGLYYAFGTEAAGDGRFFPILSSPDLVRWTPHAGALLPLADPGAHWYWAPEVACDNGRFYLYYAVIAFGIPGHHLRVATAEHPLGPFTDQGVNLTPNERFAIDAHPFQDADGAWYLYYARDWVEPPFVGTGIAVDRLLDFTHLEGRPARVVRPFADWQLFERRRPQKGGVDWYTVEGPFVVRRGRHYVCFYSGGRWEDASYGVDHVLSDHPMGDGGLADATWARPDPGGAPTVLRTRPGQVIGPGHNSLAIAPNNVTPYVVYHGWDPEHTARMLRIDRLRWRGTRPTVDGPTTDLVPAPPPPAFAARFDAPDGTSLPPDWVTTGKWEIRGGAAVPLSEGLNTARLPGPTWTHWVLETNLQLVGEGEAGIALLNADGLDGSLAVVLRLPEWELAIRGLKEGLPITATAPLPNDFRHEAWHRLLVTRNATRVHVQLDGRFLLTVAAEVPGLPSLGQWVLQMTGRPEGVAAPQIGEFPHLYAREPCARFASTALTPHFADAFEGSDHEEPGARGWSLFSNGDTNWRVRDGWLCQQTSGRGSDAIAKGDFMESFEVSCDVRLQGARRAGLLFREAGLPPNVFTVVIERRDHQLVALLERAADLGLNELRQGADNDLLASCPLGDCLPDAPATLHAEVRAGQLALWVNGRFAFAAEVAAGSGGLALLTEDGPAAFTNVSMTWLPSD